MNKAQELMEYIIHGEVSSTAASNVLNLLGIYEIDESLCMRDVKERTEIYWDLTSHKMYLLEKIPIVKVLSEKDMGEYVIRKELWDQSDYGGGKPLEMTSAYSTFDGSYIGEADFGKWLAKHDVTKIQKSRKSNSVATLGYIENYKGKGPRWIGWSHRASCPFGIGDMLFTEREYDKMPDTTPFIKGGSKMITTMDQAKQAATNFASSVS